jgi:hypothetical protein
VHLIQPPLQPQISTNIKQPHIHRPITMLCITNHPRHPFGTEGWAMRTVAKKKCIAKIVSNSKSTHSPTYFGVWNYYKFTPPKVEKFFLPQRPLSVVSKDHVARRSKFFLATKNDLQSRSCGLSSFVPTSLVQRS